MKKQRIKKLFIEQLKKSPIVQIVCQKLDISRAIVYVWRKEDEQFRADMDAALAEGEGMINDLSESQLLQGIQNGEFAPAAFWLKHRHPKFKNKLEIDATIRKPRDALTPDQEEAVRKALELAGLLGTPSEADLSTGADNTKINPINDDGQRSESDTGQQSGKPEPGPNSEPGTGTDAGHGAE